MQKVSIFYKQKVVYVPVAQSAAETTILRAAVDGVKHKVLSCILMLSVTGTLKFTDGTDDLTGAMNISATGGFVLPASIIPYFESGRNRPLNLITTDGAARGVIVLLTEA